MKDHSMVEYAKRYANASIAGRVLKKRREEIDGNTKQNAKHPLSNGA